VLGCTEDGWFLSLPDHALMVLGPPRAGKTTGVIVPNIRVAPGPVVSTSTKRDVLLATYAERSVRGRCWLYDPVGAGPPPPGVELLRWSPIPAAEHWDSAYRAATAMVLTARPDDQVGNSRYWTDRAITVLAPLLHAAALSRKDMGEVMDWVDQKKAAPAFGILETAGSVNAIRSLTGIESSEERDQSWAWSTVSSILGPYRLDSGLESTVNHNFDPDAFVQSNDTIYICSSGRDQAAVAPLVVGLLNEIKAARYRMSATGEAEERESVLFALDELANIAPLPDLPSLVSEGASQGVLTLACLQDLSQARRRWGAEADGFLTLFGSKLVLPGVSDVRTLDAISALIGQHDVPVASTSRSSWWRGRRSWSTRRQPRLAVDDLRRGQPGCALVIEANREPGWVGLAPPSRSIPERERDRARDTPGRSAPSRSRRLQRPEGTGRER
jgi:type IV secretion system protein VirD4